ncbi:hypothetical protein [Terriglobus saanensis]|uniref:MASE1 domain protein n=1 Tax=Terriglobus saanensis (strain ATCC BAA-1853 / DSM 23119 / SP1PR4) TaxID=401053 RepID=E8V8K8_TERSS|nr:hypothetical protein [Terriglobus saanensis]ADV82987.1 MASE1 domain protein [Terriglobus saanensis SP1PR4]
MGYQQLSFGQVTSRKALRITGEFLGIVCFVALLEELIRHFGFFNGGQAVWWPTNGFALAVLLQTGRSKWPRIIVGVLFGS